MRILVIGGTLFIGRRLVTALAGAGHAVTVLHRNPASPLPKGVEGLVADRNDPAAVRAAIAGRTFDAVFDNVYDLARGTTAEQVRATAEACLRPALERYVYMSSVSAYGDGLDLTEDTPLAADDNPNPYAAHKAGSERALFGLVGLPAVALRPPFIYGPGNPYYREAFFWDRLRDSRSILVPGDGSRLMQFVHVDDLVRVCLRVLEEPRAVGQAFNVGEAPVTQEQVVEALAEAAGTTARIVYIPREKALAMGGGPARPKLYFGEYFDLPPLTMRIGKVRAALGFEPVPFNTGLRETYDWWRANNPFPPPDYRFEDELLNAIL